MATLLGYGSRKLGAAIEPVMYPNPEAYQQSFGKGEWDIAIGPRVLAPADKADSTADLWVISLIYVAAPGKEQRRVSAAVRSSGCASDSCGWSGTAPPF